MNWYSTRPEGWSEQVWRAYRTFWQTLVPALSIWLGVVATTRTWSWSGLAYSVAIPSVAAALAAWSNR
jgi:hypothetical protein